MIERPSVLKSDLEKRLSRTAWFDLPVKNLSDAMSFYQGLLGWKYRQMDNSPEQDYVMIEVGGELIGGLRQIASPQPSPAGRGRQGPGEASPMGPILYFTVEQLAPKVTRAKELGAQIVGKMVDLGNERGRYQWIRDREGNLIALWGPQ